jgi:hypothetical protein
MHWDLVTEEQMLITQCHIEEMSGYTILDNTRSIISFQLDSKLSEFME